MGWYGGTKKCPNCGFYKAEYATHNSDEVQYISCMGCGLRLKLVSTKEWVVEDSYIDPEIIGKQEIDELDMKDMNDNIIKKGSTL